MKKLIISIIIAIFAFTSCSPMSCSDYEYTLSYTLDSGAEQLTATKIGTIECRGHMVPYYILDISDEWNKLAVYGTPSGLIYDDIYKGDFNITVNSFEYKKIRDYKRSIWNGKEIK